MNDQMRALYLHKLHQEKAEKLGKSRKADRAPCLAVERLESIAQFNAKFQGLEMVGIPTKQFHSRKWKTSNSRAN